MEEAKRREDKMVRGKTRIKQVVMVMAERERETTWWWFLAGIRGRVLVRYQCSISVPNSILTMVILVKEKWFSGGCWPESIEEYLQGTESHFAVDNFFLETTVLRP